MVFLSGCERKAEGIEEEVKKGTRSMYLGLENCFVYVPCQIILQNSMLSQFVEV